MLSDTGSQSEGPNGDLGPERGLALELGARVQRRRLKLHLAAFVNHVTADSLFFQAFGDNFMMARWRHGQAQL